MRSGARSTEVTAHARGVTLLVILTLSTGCTSVLGLDDLSLGGSGSGGAAASSTGAMVTTSGVGGAGGSGSASSGTGGRCDGGAPVCFGTPTALATDAKPVALAIGDIDADGLPDIVAANAGSGTVSIFLNQGDGSFAPQFPVAVGQGPIDVVLADLDNEGRLDVAAVLSGQASLTVSFNGSSPGNVYFDPFVVHALNAAPSELAAMDLNQDNLADLVAVDAGSGMNILVNDGAGSFQPLSILVLGAAGTAVVAADIDSSGSDDVVIGLATLQGAVFHNINNAFFAGPTFPTGMGAVPAGALAAGDIDKDSDVDVVFASGSSLGVVASDGNGAFDDPSFFQVGAGAVGVALADLDGDGKRDVAVACSTAGEVQILLGSDDTTFSPPVSLGGMSSPAAVAVADLDGDGRLDVVVADSATDQVWVFFAGG